MKMPIHLRFYYTHTYICIPISYIVTATIISTSTVFDLDSIQIRGAIKYQLLTQPCDLDEEEEAGGFVVTFLFFGWVEEDAV